MFLLDCISHRWTPHGNRSRTKRSLKGFVVNAKSAIGAALSRRDHLVFIPLHYTRPCWMGHGRGRTTGHYAFMKIICSSGTSRVGNWAEIVLIVINHVWYRRLFISSSTEREILQIVKFLVPIATHLVLRYLQTFERRPIRNIHIKNIY